MKLTKVFVLVFDNPKSYNSVETMTTGAKNYKEALKIGREIARDERQRIPGYKLDRVYLAR